MKKKVYAVLDIEMKLFTDPFVLRNDVEAKKLFKSWLSKDYFNGCPVELYCLGDWCLDDLSYPFAVTIPKRVFVDDTVDDVEEQDG